MASGASTKDPSKNVTPQVTGFSQAQPRNTAESQGGNMGVFLSWHEKVSFFPSYIHHLSHTDQTLSHRSLKSPVPVPLYASCQTAEPFRLPESCTLRQYPIRQINHSHIYLYPQALKCFSTGPSRNSTLEHNSMREDERRDIGLW
jgi:hypothetical protein